jgi:antitoxin CcdA
VGSNPTLSAKLKGDLSLRSPFNLGVRGVWTNPPGFDKNREAIFGRRGAAAAIRSEAEDERPSPAASNPTLFAFRCLILGNAHTMRIVNLEGHQMKRSPASTARKRPVNLTLSEDLVEEVRGVTGNLSGVVESLLADFMSKERERRSGIVEQARVTAALWNDFAQRNGSFADEHSTL